MAQYDESYGDENSDGDGCHTVNAGALLPEYILLGAAGLMVLWNLFREKDELVVLGIGLFAAVASGIVSVALLSQQSISVFLGAFTVDGFTHLFRLIGAGTAILVLLSAARESTIPAGRRAEYYALILVAATAIQILAGASELMTVFVALELLSITSFVLVGFSKENVRSSEAALKFFLFGVASIGVLLYGFSILFGMAGTTELAPLAREFVARSMSPLVWVAFMLVLAGFGFKILMAPFHMWGPDVYEGAGTPVTTFLAIGSKAAGFAVLLRVLLTVFGSQMTEWVVLVGILSALTMTIGNVLALGQKNIKRMLAYSSIAHGGYLLVGMAGGISALGIPGLLYYLLGYVFVTGGAFLTVIAVSRHTGSDVIDDYAGLSERAPVLAASLTIFFLSLIGIPPLVGFFGKYLLFGAAIEQNLFWLAGIAVVNSVISVGYYIPVVRTMYLLPPQEKTPIVASRHLVGAILATLILALLLGVYPEPFIGMVKNAATALARVS